MLLYSYLISLKVSRIKTSIPCINAVLEVEKLFFFKII